MKAIVRKYMTYEKNMRYVVFQLTRLEQIPQVAFDQLLKREMIDQPNVERIVQFAKEEVSKQDKPQQ